MRFSAHVSHSHADIENPYRQVSAVDVLIFSEKRDLEMALLIGGAGAGGDDGAIGDEFGDVVSIKVRVEPPLAAAEGEQQIPCDTIRDCGVLHGVTCVGGRLAVYGDLLACTEALRRRLHHHLEGGTLVLFHLESVVATKLISDFEANRIVS